MDNILLEEGRIGDPVEDSSLDCIVGLDHHKVAFDPEVAVMRSPGCCCTLEEDTAGEGICRPLLTVFVIVCSDAGWCLCGDG